MNRILILIFLTILIYSCGEETKQDVEKSRTMEVQKPRVYFGDSLITLNFVQTKDTMCSDGLEKKLYTQMIAFGHSGDTIFANLCVDLNSGVYNGAALIKNDSLILNYWLDSSDCRSFIVHSNFNYKVLAKGIDEDNIVGNFIKTKSPLRKRCK